MKLKDKNFASSSSLLNNVTFSPVSISKDAHEKNLYNKTKTCHWIKLTSYWSDNTLPINFALTEICLPFKFHTILIFTLRNKIILTQFD